MTMMKIEVKPEVNPEFSEVIWEPTETYRIKPLEFTPPGAQLPENHEYWIYCHWCDVWERDEDGPTPVKDLYCCQDDEAVIEVIDFLHSKNPIYEEIRRKYDTK